MSIIPSGNPILYSPGNKNSPFSYGMPWNWGTIGADKLGLFGDTSQQQPSDSYGGMPNYPTYVGMDPNDPSLSISGQFGPNSPLEKFSNESMRNGPSSATQLALKQNAIGANASRDQAHRLASGMAKDASANLAMKGGLGAGANERIGKYATNIGMDAAQGADAAAGQNRAGLMIADESARTGNLAQAAGLVGQNQKQRYDMMAGDVGRRQGELDRRNLFNMNNYQSAMGGWAAGKQSQATSNSGKK